MTDQKRTKRTSPSHPRLEALGWDRDEPTLLIKKGLDKLEKTADEARQKIVEQIALTKQSASRA